jgi:DNA-binding transcriptional LysR family regulator
MALRMQRRYFKEMRLQQLRGLCELARRGSFAAAASALRISRPAIWQQIRALEQEFDATLVQRRGRKAELTEDGRLLLEIVSPLVASFAGVRTAFQDRKDRLVRHLVVATTASLLANELRQPLREYRQRYANVQLTVMDRPSPGGMAMLEEGQADLAILAYLDEERRHPLMEYEPLFAKTFVLACRRDHPLAQRRTLRLPDLLRYPLVLASAGSTSRRRVDRVLREHGLLNDCQIALDTTNGALLTNYVELGLGISVLPLSEQHPARRTLHVRSLARWFGAEATAIVRRKGEPELSHVAGFRETIRQSLMKPETEAASS